MPEELAIVEKCYKMKGYVVFFRMIVLKMNRGINIVE
jgi:hypothetical protein